MNGDIMDEVTKSIQNQVCLKSATEIVCTLINNRILKTPKTSRLFVRMIYMDMKELLEG